MSSRDPVSPVDESTLLTGTLGIPVSRDNSGSAPKARPRSTGIFSSLPEVFHPEGKEVATHDEKETLPAGFIPPSRSTDDAPKEDGPFAGETHREESRNGPVYEADRPSEKRRRMCGMSVVLFALLLALLAVAIGLGVGLGVGLTRKSSSASASSTTGASATATAAFSTSLAPSATPTTVGEVLVGGAVNPSYYSTTGAFNGTGLDINSAAFVQNFPGFANQSAQVILYFQHHSGDLRWAGLNDSGWFGGGPNQTIATDAKNATSISTAAFAYNSKNYWRIYYVDKNNKVRERVLASDSTTWQDGPLNSLNVSAMDSERVGLLACYFGSSSADTELSAGGGVGLRLWAASNATTFQQYSWNPSTNWTYNAQWPGLNGHATPACYSWGGNSTTYISFVDLQNRVNFFWRDASPGKQPTEAHPINQWTNTSITIPAVNPSTQLQIGVFAPDIVWAQSLSDNRLRGYTMDWAAEDTTFASGVDPIVLPPMSVNNASQVPLNGTHLAVTVIPGGRVIVFDQVTGADITVRTQKTAGTLASSGDAGAWDMGTVPIPQA